MSLSPPNQPVSPIALRRILALPTCEEDEIWGKCDVVSDMEKDEIEGSDIIEGNG